MTGHAWQAAMVNTLEVPAYRVYTLEELKEATDNFSSSNLIKTSPLAQVCSNRFFLALTGAWKAMNIQINVPLFIVKDVLLTPQNVCFSEVWSTGRVNYIYLTHFSPDAVLQKQCLVLLGCYATKFFFQMVHCSISTLG